MVHLRIIFSLCLLLAKTSDSDKLKNDGILSVTSVTTSSITLNWAFPNISVNEWSSPELKYRLKNAPILPPSFQQNHATQCSRFPAPYYVALDARKESEQWVEPSYVVRNVTGKPREIAFQVLELPFPNQKYEIEVRLRHKTSSYRNSMKSARMVALTKPDVPRSATRTGAGCFRVYDLDEASRRVKIYTRENYQYPSEVRVYEELDGQTTMVHSSNESLDVYGTMQMTISLKRNYFVLRQYNRLGVSDQASVVNVPPQEEILSASLNTAIYNETTRCNVLRWCKPENLDVTNYTIFWLDSVERGSARSILDFVHVPANVTSLQVRGNKGFVRLGLSVNTATSSSGLQIVQQIET